MNEIKETLVCQMYRVVSFIDTVIDVYKFLSMKDCNKILILSLFTAYTRYIYFIPDFCNRHGFDLLVCSKCDPDLEVSSIGLLPLESIPLCEVFHDWSEVLSPFKLAIILMMRERESERAKGVVAWLSLVMCR